MGKTIDAAAAFSFLLLLEDFKKQVRHTSSVKVIGVFGLSLV